MRRVLSLSLAALLAAAPAARAADSELEKRFDAAIVAPAQFDAWMKTMAAAPNHVGSLHDRANAEMTLALFKAWGWDARIETFQVLYPTPLELLVEQQGGKPFKATLTETPLDAGSAAPGGLPAYLAFQGDGDVTAPLVYVNYGMPDDYKALERLGVSVKGKIAIARYGGGWRGLKPKLAAEHGAVGVLIYSDPKDDGYGVDDVYPAGPARPPTGIQRGSVADMMLYPGDPLTPGVGATAKARRLTRDQAQTLVRIPALPISYGDAQVLMAGLKGPMAPAAWRGGLPIAYHVGGEDGPPVRLKVRSDWSLKTIYDVVGVMKGAELPDEWVLRGNHRDGWVNGASDPLSGHIAMMAEAKAIGELAKSGWRPKRTLVYLSWDAEEPMLLGSTEWAETHADELRAKGVAYVNSDENGRGFLYAGGTPGLQHLVTQVAGDVTDPQTGVSVAARLRAKAQVDAAEPGAGSQQAARARMLADPAKDLPLSPLGSGSDFSPFLNHIGLPVLNIGFGGEGSGGGVYHSAYDTYEHHTRFVDPGFAYAGALARTGGRLVLRLAEGGAAVQRYGDFAEAVAGYVDEIKKAEAARRDAVSARSRLLEAGAYRLADDPTEKLVAPPPLAAAAPVDFAALDLAVVRLKASAQAFDGRAARAAALPPAKARALSAALRAQEPLLAPETGLPGRPWYKHLIYAPGRLTGYGAKTLPGVREAVEDGRSDEAQRYVAVTAAALTAYADGLDKAGALIDSP